MEPDWLVPSPKMWRARRSVVGAAGMGIRIMRYRARMIGTTLDLKSRPNQGTQIDVQFTAQPEDSKNE